MGAQAQDLREEAIEAHLPLVRSIARRYLRSGEPLEDLVQAGTIGLIKAVDRYDPQRHPDLAALARPSIEGEIRHHLRDGGAGPHVSRTDRELAGRVRIAAADLQARQHRQPTLAEVAAEAGLDEDRAARALQALDASHAVPLDDGPLATTSQARGDDSEAAEARVLLQAGWSLLDERERRMLELRYREDRSQAEIARELGLSQAHVSRLLRGALARLREAVEGSDDADVAESPIVRSKGSTRNGRLLLRVSRSLHDDLACAAEREGVSLNTYITGTLARAVGRNDVLPLIDDPSDGQEAPIAPLPPARASRLLVLNAIIIALATLAGLALLAQAWLGL